jgi:hypothetical protein
MSTNSFRICSRPMILTLVLVFVASGTILAQESPFAASMRTTLVEPARIEPVRIEPMSPSPLVQRPDLPEATHRFWDRDNRILFATVGAMSTADFFVTRANLARGGPELNPVTRVFSGSTAGLALNFAGETAGSIGISYLFHKTGHHKLERITSLVNIGSSAGAIGYGLAHR